MNLRRNFFLISGLVAIAASSHSHGQSCAGDLSEDGRVDGVDLAILLAEWGPCAKSCSGDINSDGQVDGVDIAQVLAGWGYCPLTWATVLEQAPDPAVVTDPALREAIVATGRPWRVRDNASQIEMLLVPPGAFNMGCSASHTFGCSSNENPVHVVTLTQPFYLGRYEVTQGEWQAVMGSNPSFHQGPNFPDALSHPVETVTWNMANAFNAATGLRLPTEAEWEYAYRAETSTAYHSFPGYPSGTSIDALLGEIAWYGMNSYSPGLGYHSRPVGIKQSNGFGLHDMAGNVFEWVNDWYSANYYQSSPAANPSGPSAGTARVYRGGSWGSGSRECRSSWRNATPPDSAGPYGPGLYGFRVARNP